MKHIWPCSSMCFMYFNTSVSFYGTRYRQYWVKKIVAYLRSVYQKLNSAKYRFAKRFVSCFDVWCKRAKEKQANADNQKDMTSRSKLSYTNLLHPLINKSISHDSMLEYRHWSPIKWLRQAIITDELWLKTFRVHTPSGRYPKR